MDYIIWCLLSSYRGDKCFTSHKTYEVDTMTNLFSNEENEAQKYLVQDHGIK